MSHTPAAIARRVLLVVLGWAVLVLFFGSQTYVSYSYSAAPITWSRALQPAVFEWTVWAALLPLVLFLARRFPIDRPHRLRAVLVHLVAGSAVAALKTGLYFALLHAFVYRGPDAMRLPRFFTFQFHPSLLAYWVMLGLVHARRYYVESREREVRASQLEARLAEARLEVLRMQLHPHFLFNTLHAISALMHRDVEAADRMLSKLSDLLRLTLETGAAQEVTLRRELEFLDGYLEIQRTRFQDRLRIEQDVDATLLDAMVPHLILQPLVENAIRHGIGARAAGGRIGLVARAVGARLELAVWDDGPGLGASAAAQGGVGLANTRARLAQLYGAAHQFDLRAGAQGGVEAILSVPLRFDPGTGGAPERLVVARNGGDDGR